MNESFAFYHVCNIITVFTTMVSFMNKMETVEKTSLISENEIRLVLFYKILLIGDILCFYLFIFDYSKTGVDPSIGLISS